MTAALGSDGALAVSETVTFDDDSGGTIELPGGSVEALDDGVRNVTVDGQPAEASGNAFGDLQLRIPREQATVAYRLTDAIDRYADIAVLDFPVLPSPDVSSRSDPDVALSGTLTLPGPTDAAGVQPHYYGGRDRKVATDGATVTFSSRAPVWSDNDLVVALPSALVPGVEATPFAFAPTFAQTQETREASARTTESTLRGLERGVETAEWVLLGLAIGLPAIFWIRLVVHAAAVKLEQRREVRDVPEHLIEPPSGQDPAVVSVLWGEGAPERRAVAGTMLALARRRAIDIDEYGPERLVVKVPLTETGVNRSEEIVLHALRSEATPEGVIQGPPVWRSRTRWWRGFRRDAIKRARSAGLVTRVLRFVDVSGALVTTAVGISIYFFTKPWVYMLSIFGAQVLGTTLCFVGGHALTKTGRRQRALWRSFGRYIHDHGELEGVGPAGVVMWGPYLVYGVVLDEADHAARVLTPRARAVPPAGRSLLSCPP